MYKQVSCPKCGKNLRSAYVGSSCKMTVVVPCIHCNQKYRIEYGLGKATIKKA